MLKMVLPALLFILCFLGLTGAGQESIELLKLYDTEVLKESSHSGIPIAVSVNSEDLNEVSSSVLMAESWLRTHVLAHFPKTKITTIVVGDGVLCQKDQELLGQVLPSLKNIHYSLTRWGLEREIKVSAFFSYCCFHQESALFRDDLARKVTKPLLGFLHTINSTFSLNPPPNVSPLSKETLSLISSSSDSMKKLGFLGLNRVNVLVTSPKQETVISRKLSSIESKLVKPHPARPTPLPEISKSPLHSFTDFSVPATVIKSPIVPLPHTFSIPPLSFPHDPPPPRSSPQAYPPPLSFPRASPPPMTFPFAPELPPGMGFATPPYGFTLPPCAPTEAAAPAPGNGMVQRLWCVAKPSVPSETLQLAMDYACGEGGADCYEIMPQGSCFYPDTVVAHASYAFNSYWQKTKRNGGTCNFDGTAMLINADPSFLHCSFVLR
ncbi:putative Glucan endo-1 3-beta-glucosidase [Tripterygium wilfordii]|uniref:glucan endo-1,3-beta-D-glucosidase n=1 Tax=Tripterygium wilfordii TaxID=458696 RepID=A0A7J7E2K8_TRIWF|nr:glucan endo-1,3-beta-glucosidase 12-like [Tripterygium wilfordii]KAF5752838.1 putative Glucan endo-1 3-beta-glucosidase [Tripterygium wilfordii]